MERDNVIDKNLESIRQDLIRDYGLDLEIDVLADIVDSQFKMVKVAMSNKKSIKLNYLGSFRIKRGREDSIATENELRNSGLSEERKAEIRQARGTAFRDQFRKDFTKLDIKFK